MLVNRVMRVYCLPFLSLPLSIYFNKDIVPRVIKLPQTVLMILDTHDQVWILTNQSDIDRVYFNNLQLKYKYWNLSKNLSALQWHTF